MALTVSTAVSHCHPLCFAQSSTRLNAKPVKMQLAATAVVVVCGLYLSASPRIIREWERGVLLRLGRFQAVLGPGIWLYS